MLETRARESAVVLAHDRLTTNFAKTAHGLIRGPSRYEILAVVDPGCAGRDAGVVLDGRPRQIPVVASFGAALARAPRRPEWCVVGVATPGGFLPEALYGSLCEAAAAGISLVSGLHRLLGDDPELARLARAHGGRIVDLRRPRPTSELRFWTGEVLHVSAPRIAVLGTDCAVGKRTTTTLLRAALVERGIAAEMVYTGQTGWLQGIRHGFILDATPNDFVCGELERAILECARESAPEVILLEGQSALRNPSGPCGSELLLAGAAAGVVLQHVPGRRHFTDLEEADRRIPPLAEEVQLVRLLGSEVWAVTLNAEGLAEGEVETVRARLAGELGLPVVVPLQGGVGELAALIATRLEGAAMKILRIESWSASLPLTRPYTIATQTIAAVELFFVRLVSTTAVGLGSASPAPGVTGETPEACAAALAPDRLDWLAGRDPRHLGGLCRELGERLGATPAARAALDMALWDLFARSLGVPVVDLLGRRHQGLATSITIGIQPTAETLAEADEYLGRGFCCLKVKIGLDLEHDLERLARLREHVGPEIRLRVDANQGYDLGETRWLGERLAPLALELIEQPVAAAATPSLRGLPAELVARIAADESLHDERDALALAQEPPACGIWNLKLMKCGGITPALGIARIAELAGRELMWGCMDESALGLAAALHAAYACPATRYLDLDGNFDLARDLAVGGYRVEQGRLVLGDEPGLGVRLEG